MNEIVRQGIFDKQPLPKLKVAHSSSGKNEIVTPDGSAVLLRGIGIGGYFIMENFITGFSGVECTLRKTFKEELGQERTDAFFDGFLNHFFTEEDIKMIKLQGANCIRLPLNYHHFEDDERPFKYKREGFERVDQVIKWSQDNGLYVILDMHAVQGGQNPDWHSDNPIGHALLWEHPHFQDRYLYWLQEIVGHYEGNTTVAGYDLLNEPDAPNWRSLNSLYERAFGAVREIDTEHIIFYEGNAFGSRFQGLLEPQDDNAVVSSHKYSRAQFGPGPYPGSASDGTYLDKNYYTEVFNNSQEVEYANKNNVPLWIGEFGSAYNIEGERYDRLRAMKDQIEIFDAAKVHWTSWTYKDIGVQGLVFVDKKSPYMEKIRPILEIKKALVVDSWPPPSTRPDLTKLGTEIESLAGRNKKLVGDIDRSVSNIAARQLQYRFVELFKNMSPGDIEEMMEDSFELKNCQPNSGLVEIIYTQKAA